MEKRLFLAVALSIAVMVTWQALFVKRQPIEAQLVASKNTAGEPAPEIKPREIIPAAESIQSLETAEISFNGLELVYFPSKAAVKEVILNKYQKYVFSLHEGLFLNAPELHFKKERAADGEISFVHSDSVKKITQKIIFDPRKEILDIEITVKNTSSQPLPFEFPLVLGQVFNTPSDPASRYQDVVISTPEKVMHLNPHKYGVHKNIKFIALRDQYFCAVLQPQDEGASAYISKVDKSRSEIGISSSATIQPDSQIVRLFHVYFGPQDVKTLNAVHSEWAAIVNYGTFDFISHVILQFLRGIHGVVRNWGVALILLSIVVYLVLYPLTIKQMKSMKAMQDVQPKVEAIRKTYKDNPQRMNKEIMELYKHHKVNPFGGCLPLVLQTPIFFALYQALSRSIELRGAHFLWIKDLSSPDKLFLLPTSLPFIGNEINLLPVLMTVGMFFQQKMSLSKSGGEAAEQQKMMLYIFPVMFCVFFYKMPSGLVMYWFVNSMLMLLNQVRINKSK